MFIVFGIVIIIVVGAAAYLAYMDPGITKPIRFSGNASPSPSPAEQEKTYYEIVTDSYLYPMSTSLGIQAWPELVGFDVHEARRILESRTSHRIELVPAQDLVIGDFDIERIRLIHDPKTMCVTDTPRVG
jgi:hypothetical protein